eukprot:2546804-Rhodomonas_salina.2
MVGLHLFSREGADVIWHGLRLPEPRAVVPDKVSGRHRQNMRTTEDYFYSRRCPGRPRLEGSPDLYICEIQHDVVFAREHL